MPPRSSTEPKPFDPADGCALRPQRAFTLAAAFAARFAGACALRGDAAADVVADLLVEFCEEVEDEAERAERAHRDSGADP